MAKSASGRVVDLPNGGFTPPAGWWTTPSHYMGSSASAVTGGVGTFTPFDFSAAVAIQAVGVHVSTAQVGGALTVSLALYEDDGSGGQPDWTRRLTLGTVTVTATGTRSYAVTGLTVHPGRYWGAHLQVQTTAPTTQPQYNCIGNNAPQLPFPNGLTIGGTARALRLTGLAALPTALPTGLGVTGALDAPVVAVRVA